MSRQQPIIRASEIGEYAFCARAWWLQRIQGHPTRHPERLARGIVAHARHGQRVAASRWLLWLGLACLLGAAALLLQL